MLMYVHTLCECPFVTNLNTHFVNVPLTTNSVNVPLTTISVNVPLHTTSEICPYNCITFTQYFTTCILIIPEVKTNDTQFPIKAKAMGDPK